MPRRRAAPCRRAESSSSRLRDRPPTPRARPARRAARSRSGCGSPRGRFGPLGDLHLAHLVLLDLAGDGHREAVDEAEVARDLVPGDLAPAELAQLFAVELRPVAEDDPRTDL